MSGDLGMGRERVHAGAEALLDFWFALPDDRHFAKDAALDREIADRFGDLIAELVATEAAHCWDDPDTLLGAVIALDQFTRNIHRGSAAAFAGDEVARWLTLHAIGKGWDDDLAPDRRAFLYMPLMHAEDWGLQLLSVGKFEQLGRPENLDFARAHCDAIGQFGRFPGRNTALRRHTTTAERAWLKENNGGW